MNQIANKESDRIEPTIRALQQLSPSSQSAVAALVRQLAEGEGISVEPTNVMGLRSPADGIPLWLAKLKAERLWTRSGIPAQQPRGGGGGPCKPPRNQPQEPHT